MAESTWHAVDEVMAADHSESWSGIWSGWAVWSHANGQALHRECSRFFVGPMLSNDRWRLRCDRRQVVASGSHRLGTKPILGRRNSSSQRDARSLLARIMFHALDC
jgi:hypothetical protein